MADPPGRRGSVGGFSAWMPTLTAELATMKTKISRFVFQIDEEQEARMRAYLDETYGDKKRGDEGERPIQMDALRCAGKRGKSEALLCVCLRAREANGEGLALLPGRGRPLRRVRRSQAAQAGGARGAAADEPGRGGGAAVVRPAERAAGAQAAAHADGRPAPTRARPRRDLAARRAHAPHARAARTPARGRAGAPFGPRGAAATAARTRRPLF
jgi:hypothetical protein